MFRSIVVAFAALLVVGQVRDKAGFAESPGERDQANGAGEFSDAGWALASDRSKARREPVSEL